MQDHPLQKITILGPTLTYLIQRVSSSPCDVDSLLFGHVTQITHSTLSDDTSSSASLTNSPSHLVATITSFLCSSSILSFYNPHGRLHPLSPHHHLLGWFSACRKTTHKLKMSLMRRCK